jgi:uncharacterized phage infection (PIP) family protein YhgE
MHACASPNRSTIDCSGAPNIALFISIVYFLIEYFEYFILNIWMFCIIVILILYQWQHTGTYLVLIYA